MICSSSKGTRESASGWWQYSHRPPDRSRTRRCKSASMPGSPLVSLAEGVTCLGVHQIEKGTDAEIVLQLFLLGRCQLVVLVPNDQIVQAVQISLLELQPEQGFCLFIR